MDLARDDFTPEKVALTSPAVPSDRDCTPASWTSGLSRYARRAIVDTFTSGDGSRDRRTARSQLPEQYAAADLGDWRNEEEARTFYRLLVEKMGAGRVGWSEEGFNGLPSVGEGHQPSLL